MMNESSGSAQPNEYLREDVSLPEIAYVLLNRWRLFVGFPMIASLVAAGMSLLMPAKYTATSAFVPETEAGTTGLPAGLIGLASQFGVSAGRSTESPNFYADILRSRTLLDQALLAEFPRPIEAEASDSAQLLDILQIQGESTTERLEKGRKALLDRMSVRVDNGTNIVTLGIETRYPELSADIANLCIQLLNDFNLSTRQISARETRRFIEERLGAAERELADAETELMLFLQGNRLFQDSPNLQFQHDRLQRHVLAKQELLTTLQRQYEDARIQEVNDTPMISIVDRAVAPDRRSSPRRTLIVILAFMLGLMGGGFGVLLSELVSQVRQKDAALASKFSSRWADMKRELRTLPFRRARR